MIGGHDNKEFYEKRLKNYEYTDPYIEHEKDAKFWNMSVYFGDKKLYSGDLNEYRLHIIREYTKHTPGQCAMLIDERGLRDMKPIMVACNGKLFDVSREERKLESIDVEEVHETTGIGGLFG